MHDFDSRSGLRRSLALLGFAIPLFAGLAAAIDHTEDQRLIWIREDDLPLPAFSHLGATLAMTESGVWIAAPAGGGWTTRSRDPGAGWVGGTSGPNPLAPQAFAAARHSDVIVRTALTSDGTTSIVALGDGVYVSGIAGDVGAVAGDRTVLAYGQPDYNGGAGRVWIYVLDAGTWQLELTVTGGAGNRLGAAIAVKDPFVHIGAPGRGANGSVFVYARAGEWFQWQRIDSPSTSQVDEDFGAAIAVDGQWLAIGGPLHDRFTVGGGQADCGGVWVYGASGLQYELDAFVLPAGIASGDRFGTSVALRRIGGLGAALVAGSPREDHQFLSSGAAYLFLRSATGGWSERLRLVDSDPSPGDNLGATVALNGHDVLAGAPNASANDVFQQGQVLVFRDVVPLLSDGFESANLAAWNGAVP